MSTAVPITVDMLGNPIPLASLITKGAVFFMPCDDGSACALPTAHNKKDKG